MTGFHHRIKSGKKGSASRNSAYITRSGKYGDRDDLISAGFGNLPAWAEGDPKQFWRAADRHERSNGAAYREQEIALPNELSNPQLIELAETIVNEVVPDKPYQYAIHCPISSIGGVRNPHLHLMYSDRMQDGIVRSPQMTFARYNPQHPARGGARKDSGGRTRLELRDEVIGTRKKIADLQNQALLKYGHVAKMDHRSLRDRGIARPPERRYAPVQIKRMSAQDRQQLVASRAVGES